MGALSQCREAVARNLVRHTEAFAGGRLNESAGERFARREGHRVYHDVERTPLALQQLEGRIALTIDRHIEGHREMRAERVSQRLDALAHLVVEVGEGELR